MTKQELEFNSDKAFVYLKEHGEVYTLRTKPNLNGIKAITHNGEFQFNATVTFISQEPVWFRSYDKTTDKWIPDFAPFIECYVKESGFKNCFEWLEECSRFRIRIPHFPDSRWLYLYHVKNNTFVFR